MKHLDRLIATGLLLLLSIPMLWAAAAAVAAGGSGTAWRALLVDPQTLQALGLSLFTGLLATGLSVMLAAWLLSRHFPSPAWARLVRLCSPMLAVPHAAFAIGLVFLIAPSGWLLRALSPWATGLQVPPPWVTTQDPCGLGLVAVLVAKEVPFLLWAAATQLQRMEVAERWERELQVARSMGYAPHTAWWRVLWPQLWPRLRWPLLAVLAYNLTVVDMALVIGPTSPPTLAVLAWQWLMDSSSARNAQGAAAAWLLAAAVAGTSALMHWASTATPWRNHWTQGQRGAVTAGNALTQPGTSALGALVLLYGAVMVALAVGSMSGYWPFPALWPESWTLQAWISVAGSASTLGTTLTLALGSALASLLWAVAWLECAPARWQAVMNRVIYLPLVLPAVLWVVGVHSLALHWQIDTTWLGVWLAHTLATVPYVLLALNPAYTGFDQRLWHVTASLGHRRAVFLTQVKWPLLRAALLASFAIGFAVSVAQYLPTLFVGAGRLATVTTEAVTLASGAQRSLTSAYAWLQWLLPLSVFGVAAWLGQPRKFKNNS